MATIVQDREVGRAALLDPGSSAPIGPMVGPDGVLLFDDPADGAPVVEGPRYRAGPRSVVVLAAGGRAWEVSA